MKEYVEIRQTERQMILYDLFSTLEAVSYSDIRFVLKQVEKRTLQRDLKDLSMAGMVHVTYSNEQKAYVPCDEGEEKTCEISDKKAAHLEKLKRLAFCMTLTESADPIAEYMQKYPNASKRMRERDFEVLRNIGFLAGYDRLYQEYRVDYGEVNAYDGYGVCLKNGKLIRYRE